MDFVCVVTWRSIFTQSYQDYRRPCGKTFRVIVATVGAYALSVATMPCGRDAVWLKMEGRRFEKKKICNYEAPLVLAFEPCVISRDVYIEI
jgi:hypothetical protein